MPNRSEEFLAVIRLAMEGAESTLAKLKTVEKATTDMTSKQVEFPWLKNFPQQADTAQKTLSGFSKELLGFAAAGEKLNTVWKDGEPIGAKSVQTFRNQAGAIKQVTTEFDKNGQVVGQSLQEIYRGAAQAAPLIEQFGLALRRALIVAPVWMALRSAMMGLISLVRENVKFLVELESGLARIKIVGQGTEEEFKRLGTTLTALGVVYGVTASDAIKAAATFAQQGRNVTETIELTRVSALAAKVLGQDINDAVDNITAGINSFNLGYRNAITLVDKWINVERNFAVTGDDLARATKVAGSTANAFGVSISAFLGDVTAVIEKTRQSGDAAANALKFIYARLLTNGRRVLERFAKVPIFLKNGTEATFEQTKVLRSATDVLDDLASKWSRVGSAERTEIAIQVASKRQSNAFLALMDNYNRSLDARISALTSAGQAERAFGIEQDTTKFKVQQLTSAWNLLATAVADTRPFKGALDFFTDMAEAVTFLIDRQKAYEAEAIRQGRIVQAGIDKQKNELAVVQELIELRTKLNARPISEKNNQRLEAINQALKEIAETSPQIASALENQIPEAIKNQVTKLQEDLSRKEIVWNVKLQFAGQIAALEDKLKGMSKDRTLFNAYLGDTKEEQKIREELMAIRKKENDEIKKQIALNDANVLAMQIAAISVEDAESESEELTKQEEERLNIEEQLAEFSLQFADNQEAIVSKEIELVKQSTFAYGIHEKTTKLADLHNKLIQTRLQQELQEKNYLIDLTLQEMRLRGATQAQIDLVQAALEKQVFGEDKLRNDLSLRLKLEEDITKEKLNQTEIGRESLKLYDISQKYGISVATEIGKFITGQIDFSRLREMPKIFEIFKKEYVERFKEIQASLFLGIPFKGFGNFGGPRMNAPGASIPVPEYNNIALNLTKQLVKISSAANKPVSINGLNVSIAATIVAPEKGSIKERAAKITIDIADAIRNNNEVKKAIAERIEEF